MSRQDAAAGRRRQSVLDPTERFSEILFGLIMVLTFTGSLSAAQSGRHEVRTMLVGALGCNLAWGIIDSIFYLMNTLGARGHGIVAVRRLRRVTDPAEARALLEQALPEPIAGVLEPDDYERLRQRLSTLPNLPKRAPLHRDDLRGAVSVFFLVFLSTFPVALPFLFMTDAMLALRVSNAIAIVLLFVGGYRLARYSGFHPWRTGLAMVAIGIALVGLTIALGG